MWRKEALQQAASISTPMFLIRTKFSAYICYPTPGCSLLQVGDRQFEPKGAAFAGGAENIDATPVFFHDALDDAQP